MGKQASQMSKEEIIFLHHGKPIKQIFQYLCESVYEISWNCYVSSLILSGLNCSESACIQVTFSNSPGYHCNESLCVTTSVRPIYQILKSLDNKGLVTFRISEAVVIVIATDSVTSKEVKVSTITPLLDNFRLNFALEMIVRMDVRIFHKLAKEFLSGEGTIVITSNMESDFILKDLEEKQVVRFIKECLCKKTFWLLFSAKHLAQLTRNFPTKEISIGLENGFPMQIQGQHTFEDITICCYLSSLNTQSE